MVCSPYHGRMYNAEIGICKLYKSRRILKMRSTCQVHITIDSILFMDDSSNERIRAVTGTCYSLSLVAMFTLKHACEMTFNNLTRKHVLRLFHLEREINFL